MNRETMDDISAMRYGVEQGLRDLKWTECTATVPGETMYVSPGDSVCFTMSESGTYWAFGYDDTKQVDVIYKTFAEGDTWKEFERALLLAQAIEEEKLGTRQDLIGKWWDSWGIGPEARTGRRAFFNVRGLHLIAATYADDAWRSLTGHEREIITNEVLKGVTK